MADPTRPEGIIFHPVSPSLLTVRLIGIVVWMGIPAIGLTIAAIVAHPAFWAAAIPLWILIIVSLVLVSRQVKALGWAEGPSEFLIRKGVMFRRLTVIPYGRIQYVDVKEGPIARMFGITSITLHTASSETAGSLDGLPAEQAANLRDMLAQRGSADLAGL